MTHALIEYNPGPYRDWTGSWVHRFMYERFMGVNR